MRYLTIAEVLYLHRMVIAQSGSSGIRDLGGLESAIAQPLATFAGSDLSFRPERFDLSAPVSEQEELILALAGGSLSRRTAPLGRSAHPSPSSTLLIRGASPRSAAVPVRRRPPGERGLLQLCGEESA